jgi:predicted CXXCH cytochrome family protein
VHAPAARDCLRCHGPHAADEEPLLQEAVLPLCSGCHEVTDEAFTESHLGIDPAVMSCADCHDPHGSDDPGFFDSEVHAPFAARDCEDCHEVSAQ